MKLNKEEVKARCLEILGNKINILREGIAEVQGSSNNETKSTAGDKHETSRAMAQLEVERLSQQLHQQEKLMTLLHSMPTSSSTKAEAGSIVVTDKSVFYLGVAVGIIELNSTKIMTMGMSSPLSQLMLNKTEGDSFSFNNIKYIIKEII